METWSGAEEPEPSPGSVCPICKGAGFVYANVSLGHPHFGKAVPCRCTQKELDKERQARLQQSSGLDLELLKSMTFDNFKLDRHNLSPQQCENLKKAFDTALDFAKSPDGWLVFQGETGCGKTHLACAIANYRLKAGKTVKFEVVPDFLDHLRFTFSPESQVSYDQVFEEVKSTPLLILDDFGEHSTTPWAQEKLYQVINYRHNARLATVITTRLTTEEIDSPIVSRFFDNRFSMVLEIRVPDYRTDRTSHSPKAPNRRGRKGR